MELLSADAVRVQQGMPVRLLRWGGDQPLQAIVKRVEPTGFTKISALGVEEQRVLVICDISSDYETWKDLGDGYRVEAEFIIGERAGVLQVPASALFRQAEQWAAYRVVDGRAVLAPLQPGLSNGLSTQVLEGLAEGDAVIIYPGDNIADGVRVRPRH